MSLEEIFRNQQTVDEVASRNHTVSGNNGMVSCPVKEAAVVGEDILKKSGNAIDAIIAIQLALSVVEGMNTGIGGGGVILYYDNENKDTKVINGQGKAPSAVQPDLFYDENGDLLQFDERSTSPRSIAVPGVMRMMEKAYHNYGSLPLEHLIDPAIHLAEDGFSVNSSWERALDRFQERLGEEAKKLFVPNGQLLKEGDYFHQPELAETLKIIRRDGFSSFYEGEIADNINETLSELGGLMTKEDLVNYQATIEEPLNGSYKDYELSFPAPPSGGGLSIAQLLKIFEKMDISQYDIHSWEKYHIVAEATRIVLADKQTYIGDCNFVTIPIEGMLHDDYINERMKLIDFNKKKETIVEGDPWKYDGGKANYKVKMDTNRHGMDTTHFTVVDQWGNIAACTTSLERIFGSGIMVFGHGFMLNNDLTDFNPERRTANEPDGNKSPASSKSPTLIYYKGKPFFTLGSPGATTIISSVAQVILHVLDYKLDLKEAISEVRIFNNPELSMEWEDGINKETMAKLQKIGYELDKDFMKETADNRLGDVKGILIEPWNDKLYGAVDSTRPGRAIGIRDTQEN